MKFISESNNDLPTEETGEIKIRKAFLIFPKRIGNITRWLEVAEWEERYSKYYNMVFGTNEQAWVETRWLDIENL